MKAQALIQELGGVQDAGNSDWRILLARLVKHLKAKQIIELGANEGWSGKFMLEQMGPDAHLYSVDIMDGFGHMIPEDPRVTKILSDDIEMSIWDKHNVDLKKTDLWEIDSDHSFEHISKQWELYSPYFKKGCVVAIDDVISDFPGVWKFWDALEADKFQINRAGIVVI